MKLQQENMYMLIAVAYCRDSRQSPFDVVAEYLITWYLLGSVILLMWLGGVIGEKSSEERLMFSIILMFA